MKSVFLTMVIVAALGVIGLDAATVPVTSVADNGFGTLRTAIASAADGDIIQLNVSGTIQLTSGQLVVSNNVELVGPGPSLLTISGNNSSRVIYVSPHISVAISGLTIANGRITGGGLQDGAGILNDRATLLVSNCVISGNVSVSGQGAGLCNEADHEGAVLEIVSCSIIGNSSGEGGGLANLGSSATASVEMRDSIICSNANGGVLNLSDSVGTNVTMQISNSRITDNHSPFGYGGGIRNFKSMLTIVSSTLDGNSCGGGGASGYGGGIYNAQGVVIIRDSTLSHNYCEDHGGGIYSEGFNRGDATVELINTTVSANRAYRGGGVYNKFGDALLQILNCTFSGNIAPEEGKNIDTFAGIVEIGSTILDVGDDFGDSFHNGFGPVHSLGYNLSSDDSGPNDVTDMLNTDPKLGPLKDNGGPTFTHKPLACSPAIDSGRNFTELDSDQRGPAFGRTYDDVTRTNSAGGDGTDIGAFEFQTAVVNTPPVFKFADTIVAANEQCVADALIDDGSYDPDDGDALTFVQDPPGLYLLGTNAVTLTITDRCGSSESGTAFVYVVDKTPPTILCPEFDIYVPAGTLAGEFVTYEPSATDLCSPVVSLLAMPPSGSLFSNGDTFVTFTGADSAGNTNSCTFKVHVFDTAEQLLNLAAYFESDYPQRVKNALVPPLLSASRAAAAGHSRRACRLTNVFLRRLQKKAPEGPISSDIVQYAIETTAHIRSLLDCP